MTTFEHALLGINGAIAVGLHRRPHGWKWVASSGVAAIAPDWDGLPMLINMSRFETGHRVWGHNIFTCALMAMLLTVLFVKLDLWERVVAVHDSLRKHSSPIKDLPTSTWFAWWLVMFVAALSQIPADIVVSGGKGLTDWPLQPLWPISNFSVVYPMVPWGNVGVSVLFALGMIAMAKQARHLQTISRITLMTVTIYILAWGMFFHEGR
jgi:membrane-bound metal-dependent hydrolase YbcI (DUF457 family)